jgi:iron complex transport system ATP-binding protein
VIKVSALSAKVSRDSTSDLEILSPVSFEVASGQVLGVYGPNGSGKSTLLRAMSGVSLGRTLSGDVSIAQVQIDENLSVRERVSRVLYLGSDFRTPFELTVRDLFELGAEVMNRSHGEISSVVESLGISAFLNRHFNSLSDGEKQLMMFARVLIQKPQVLIFDESFSKLDLDRLVQVAKTLRAECANGLTAVIASHDLNFLTECADSLLFLKNGKKIAEGIPSESLNRVTLEMLYPDLALHVVVSPETGRFKILY